MTTLTTSREITIMATKEKDEESFKKKEKIAIYHSLVFKFRLTFTKMKVLLRDE